MGGEEGEGRGDGERLCGLINEEEGDQKEGGGDVGHDDVGRGGFLGRGVFMLEVGQKVAGGGHNFPKNIKSQQGFGSENENHSKDEEGIEQIE